MTRNLKDTVAREVADLAKAIFDDAIEPLLRGAHEDGELIQLISYGEGPVPYFAEAVAADYDIDVISVDPRLASYRGDKGNVLLMAHEGDFKMDAEHRVVFNLRAPIGRVKGHHSYADPEMRPRAEKVRNPYVVCMGGVLPCLSGTPLAVHSLSDGTRCFVRAEHPYGRSKEQDRFREAVESAVMGAIL